MALIHYIWWGNPRTVEHQRSASSTPNAVMRLVQGTHTVKYWRQQCRFGAMLSLNIQQEEIVSAANILANTPMWAGRGIMIDGIVETLARYTAYSAVKDIISLLVLYSQGGYYFDTTTLLRAANHLPFRRAIVNHNEPQIALSAVGGNYAFHRDDRSGDSTLLAQVVGAGAGIVNPRGVDVWAMYSPVQHESLATMIDSYLDRCMSLGLNRYPSNKNVLGIPVHRIMTQEDKTMRNDLIGKLIICSVQEGLYKWAQRNRRTHAHYGWDTDLLDHQADGACIYCRPLHLHKRHAGFWRNG